MKVARSICGLRPIGNAVSGDVYAIMPKVRCPEVTGELPASRWPRGRPRSVRRRTLLQDVGGLTYPEFGPRIPNFASLSHIWTRKRWLCVVLSHETFLRRRLAWNNLVATGSLRVSAANPLRVLLEATSLAATTRCALRRTCTWWTLGRDLTPRRWSSQRTWLGPMDRKACMDDGATLSPRSTARHRRHGRAEMGRLPVGTGRERRYVCSDLERRVSRRSIRRTEEEVSGGDRYRVLTGSLWWFPDGSSHWPLPSNKVSPAPNRGVMVSARKPCHSSSVTTLPAVSASPKKSRNSVTGISPFGHSPRAGPNQPLQMRVKRNRRAAST